MGGGASKKKQVDVVPAADGPVTPSKDIPAENVDGANNKTTPKTNAAKKSPEVVAADGESKRFREKKKGFTGFRTKQETEADSGSGNSIKGNTAIKVGTEGLKSPEDVALGKKALEDFPLFEKDQMKAIFHAMSQATIEAGNKVIEKGQPFMYFVVVLSGTVTENGKPVTFFNQSALFDNVAPESDVVAETNAKLWVISRLKYQQVTVGALKARLEKGGNLLENITEIPGLKELPQETREQIALALKPQQFESGELLMKQGEVGNAMFFIEEGRVAIKQQGANLPITDDMSDEDRALAEQGIVAVRGRGEYIGEGALLDGESGLRNATALAMDGTVRCLALSREDFQEYMGSLHELFEHNMCMRTLKSIDFTKGLDESELSTLVSILEEGEYKPGEFVVRQGELGDIFYIIKEGTLECTLEENGESKRIGTLVAGDHFGEGALLTDAPRRCHIHAVGPTTAKLWGLRRDNFKRFLSDGIKQNLADTFQTRKVANNKNEEGKESVSCEWTDLQKIRTLGSGSYGTVDLVRHRVTGETYALKRIRKATVVAKKQQRFIKNERELMIAMNSRFVIKLHRTFNMEDSVYMLIEICLGGELYSLMKDTVDAHNETATGEEDFCRCFEVATQCRFYTACIALAIEYIHSKGIIHRDIKPENLLLNEKGYIKMADFGFAKMIHDQRTYSLCGTPEYTAPEVYKRSGHSKGVDWWSMGVILYEMASGYSPFHVVSQNSWDCYIEISKYEKFYPNIQFPPNFSEELCDLLLRLMHPNHSKRYGTRKANASHLKQHPFWSKTRSFPQAFPWKDCENGEYALDEKYRPRVPESGLDANNFEDCDDRHEEDAMYVDNTMMESGGNWYVDF